VRMYSIDFVPEWCGHINPGVSTGQSFVNSGPVFDVDYVFGSEYQKSVW
jgi:hypothetical protein